ncbi:12176_t:CDS:2, partial [Acaulospora colombiana]
MDRLEALGSQLSKITMYDIKQAYAQAKNMVLNVTEMEAKVHEATNDDPWGASSTLMGEIAQGQHFNEIMPAIYSRFMDKEAREWRQIYKALQLLEYIIKHGSERVVDDARSHLSTLKMLRNFHYIDERGKDQGINVRNRAKEIAELLGDLDKVRAERRKAKQNRNKYTGTGNDPTSFGSGGDYSSGGGGGGGGGFSDSTSRQQFEEYDAGDWEERPARTSTSSHTRSSSNPPRGSTTATKTSTAATSSPAKPAVPAKDKAKEVDLLGFGFDDAPAA